MTINDFISQTLSHLGASSVQTSVAETDGEVQINVELSKDDQNLVLSQYESGADALQHLCRVIFGHQYPQKKLFISINGHRELKTKKVLNLIKSVAQSVRETGQPAMINSPLSPSERFLVHKTITEDKQYQGLSSYSVGEGFGRRVVIQTS